MSLSKSEGETAPPLLVLNDAHLEARALARRSRPAAHTCISGYIGYIGYIAPICICRCSEVESVLKKEATMNCPKCESEMAKPLAKEIDFSSSAGIRNGTHVIVLLCPTCNAVLGGGPMAR